MYITLYIQYIAFPVRPTAYLTSLSIRIEASCLTEAFLPTKCVLHTLIYTDFTSWLILVFQPRPSHLLLPPSYTCSSTALSGFGVPPSFLSSLSALLTLSFFPRTDVGVFVCVCLVSPCVAPSLCLDTFRMNLYNRIFFPIFWPWECV